MPPHRPGGPWRCPRRARGHLTAAIFRPRPRWRLEHRAPAWRRQRRSRQPRWPAPAASCDAVRRSSCAATCSSRDLRTEMSFCVAPASGITNSCTASHGRVTSFLVQRMPAKPCRRNSRTAQTNANATNAASRTSNQSGASVIIQCSSAGTCSVREARRRSASFANHSRIECSTSAACCRIAQTIN